MKHILTRARVCLLLLALAGCGGGGDEDDTRAGIQPVDCKATPEVCR